MVEADEQGGALSEADLPAFVLRLFITGASPNSARAISNLTRICETHLQGKYSLEIIDVHQQYDIAKQAQIVALPLLIKSAPLPLKRLVGDMSDTEKVLNGLGIIKTK
ncbi:MAG: circadian clock protein KaiB [Sphingobacteriales bacterium]|nr:MAG: circadian clock protein KaiB [Sphingobacteriales bacterium]